MATDFLRFIPEGAKGRLSPWQGFGDSVPAKSPGTFLFSPATFLSIKRHFAAVDFAGRRWQNKIEYK